MQKKKEQQSYESLFQFILKTQYYQKIDVQKLIFIKEHRVQSITEITDLGDLFDLAHSRGEPKNQVKYNNFTTKSNRDLSISQNTAQNLDKPLCNFCSKRGHTEENCYSKSNSQSPGKLNCSFCGKRGHAIESCYAKNGRPQGNPNQHAGPQPSSTPFESRSKQKRTYQVAAVNIIQSSKTNLVFENSSLKTD